MPFINGLFHIIHFFVLFLYAGTQFRPTWPASKKIVDSTEHIFPGNEGTVAVGASVGIVLDGGGLVPRPRSVFT